MLPTPQGMYRNQMRDVQSFFEKRHGKRPVMSQGLVPHFCAVLSIIDGSHRSTTPGSLQGPTGTSYTTSAPSACTTRINSTAVASTSRSTITSRRGSRSSPGKTTNECESMQRSGAAAAESSLVVQLLCRRGQAPRRRPADGASSTRMGRHSPMHQVLSTFCSPMARITSD